MNKKKISIENAKSVRTIQSEFTEIYPYLKIEFFSKSHKPGSGSEKKFILNGNTLLKDCRNNRSTGTLEIRENMTVTELEKMFADQYGLYVQIFRRSGKLWLETTATDQWTLSYQNEQGEELSNGSLSNDREEIDYHEQE